MAQRKLFTMIDFYESLSTIDLVMVDFDNTYPHHTRKLHEWLDNWLPSLLSNEASDVNYFYQAIPDEAERGLLISGPEHGYVIYIPYPLDRPEVLIGVATLINLSQCQTFRSVVNVMRHVRKDDWVIEYPPMQREEFVALRHKLYQELREIVE